MKNYEAIIIGCGAMGSSTSYHLAKKGIKTLTLEKFELNHKNGSSHGDTRQTTAAFYSDPTYLNLNRRSVQLWLDLQNESQTELVRLGGMLIIGTPGSAYDEARGKIGRSDKQSSYQILSAKEIRERFQVFQPADNEEGLFEPKGGELFPENCVAAHVKLAERNGAEFHFNEPLSSWHSENDKIVVVTSKDRYTVDKLILCAGGWLTELVPDLHLPLNCERQAVLRFDPIRNRELFSAQRMPTWIWLPWDKPLFYGLPDFGQGLKVGIHHEGEIVASPDKIRRNVTFEDEKPIREFLQKYIPLLNGPLAFATTCVYTNTPDHIYLIDFHPRNKNVILVSPCSGEGFQNSAAIGEIVGEMATVGRSSIDISSLGLNRLKITK